MSDSTVQRYVTVDQKVDLLIERMSECVRLVREYMKDKTPAQNLGNRVVFGEMLRDFPPCIHQLQANRNVLRVAGRSLLAGPLKSERATQLGRACAMIYNFDNHSWQHTSLPALHAIRNEMKNLIRFEKNLYPQETFVGGFTRLSRTAKPLIRFEREETGDVVVVSENAWKTTCVVCFERERDVVLYPCKHCCLCRECNEHVHRCPICRASITQHRPFDDVVSNKLPYIMATHFPGSATHMCSLLMQLRVLCH